MWMCLFKSPAWEKDFPQVWHLQLFWRPSWFMWKLWMWRASSKILLQRMIYHKIHICNLCGLHEFWCGWLKPFVLWKILCILILQLYTFPWYSSNMFLEIFLIWNFFSQISHLRFSWKMWHFFLLTRSSIFL